jgi:hypothetical protein
MQKRIKLILFVLLFALLWLPFVQELTRFYKENELKGAYIKPPKPVFSIDSIKTLTFQKQFEDYENNNFGFRPFLVRAKNSFDYLLFKELSLEDNVAGKDDFIFSRSSVERTLGISYNGKEKNEYSVSRILNMSQGLDKKGCKLLVVLAPSKESIIPEYLPEQYKNKQKVNTDYNDLATGIKKAEIPLVDLCAYFKQMKDTFAYGLFTKTGFHWSAYSSSFAQDHLLSSIEDLLGKPMPFYTRTGVEWSDTARDSDADFEDPLNLLFSLGQKKYVYPKLQMVPSSLSNYRPKVIIIGDSFFWQIKNQKILANVFSEDSKYWYYFANNSFPLGDVPGVPLKDLNIINELETADLVILFGSLGTTNLFPFGVADYYYDHAETFDIIHELKSVMSWDTKWNRALREKAGKASKGFTEVQDQEAKNIALEKKEFQLLAFNNKFVCADGSKNDIIVANRTQASLWETFTLYNLNDRVAILSYDNKLFSSELDKKGEIAARRTKILSWETFTMISLDNGFVAFKADNGKYLSVDPESLQLIANGTSVGGPQKFKIIYKTSN